MKPLDDFFVPQELCVGLSATQFWDTYFKDNAELGFDKFMAFRGEQNIVMDNWLNIDKSASPDESILFGQQAKMMRTM